MRYDITLQIDYEYEFPVENSRQIVKLMPADLPGAQRLIAGSISSTPASDEQVNATDFFGNDSIELAFLKPHTRLQLLLKARVERIKTKPENAGDRTVAQVQAEIGRSRSLCAPSPLHFVQGSHYSPITEITTGFAEAALPSEAPMTEIISGIGGAIFEQFNYDPKATTVATPMLDAFNGRHGVCQDFAHIMISCLRGIGVPAGYVSGLLRTIPPAGKPRLAGADAMHAWVTVWCGDDVGWIDFDPTNNLWRPQDAAIGGRASG